MGLAICEREIPRVQRGWQWPRGPEQPRGRLQPSGDTRGSPTKRYHQSRGLCSLALHGEELGTVHGVMATRSRYQRPNLWGGHLQLRPEVQGHTHARSSGIKLVITSQYHIICFKPFSKPALHIVECRRHVLLPIHFRLTR